MPLSQAAKRQPIHHRVIDLNAYAREDGLFDIEARLIDTKPFDFVRMHYEDATPAGQPLHDLWVRMTVDDQFILRAVEAASDVTPHVYCKQAEATLSVMIGERIGGGWWGKVRDRLKGSNSCTHLMELLIPMATVALQGIRGAAKDREVKYDKHGVPLKLDSCWAYGTHSDVVKWLWPNLYKPRTAAAPAAPGSAG